MFGIGLSEFAVIVCIVIVFVRPKDLPALFRRLGKLYAQAKRAYKEITEVKDQFVKSIEVAAAETESGKGGAAPAESADVSAPSPVSAPADSEPFSGDELGETGYADGTPATSSAEAETSPPGEPDPSREA